MKTSAMIVAAALAAINAQANLIPLSAYRDVSVSGIAATESYSGSIASTALGAFNRTLSNSVTGTNEEGTIFRPSSRVTQSSSITEDLVSFSLDSLAQQSTQWTYPTIAFGPVAATASSTFNLQFMIPEATTLSVLSTGSAIHVHGGGLPDFHLEISASSGGDIFSSESPFIFSGFDENTNTLLPVLIPIQPGTYTLALSSRAFAWMDPLGDTGILQANMQMRTVPDTGSTLILMLGGLAVLIIEVRKYETDEH